MLVEFRVTNFRSFNKTQTLSLVASNDKTHAGNLIEGEKFNLLKALALYGSNASGKSNLIKAIRVMRSFITGSATTMNQGDKIPGIVPFRLDLDSCGKPSTFEATLIVDGTRLEYGFSATVERVHREWLTAYPQPHQKAQRWLERNFNPDTGETEWHFRGPFKKSEKRILKGRTRDNGLVLSRGADLNIADLSNLFLAFRKHLVVLDMSDSPTGLFVETLEYVKENPSHREEVARMIQHADFGIDAIIVKERSIPVEDLPDPVFQRAPQEMLRKLFGGDSVTSVALLTAHRIHGSDDPAWFNLQQDESNGTQRFFALAGPFLDALSKGKTMVVDELECSMHPLLTRKLIEWFQSPEINKNNAQLIFATHDSTLMDLELFRRDQLFLVEKKRSGASELFSLYDFDTESRPRTTTALQRNYLAGRYGGVPKFGPLFEDLEPE